MSLSMAAWKDTQLGMENGAEPCCEVYPANGTQYTQQMVSRNQARPMLLISRQVQKTKPRKA